MLNVITSLTKPLIASVRYDKRVRRLIKEISKINEYDYVFLDYTQNCAYINDIRKYMPNAKVALIEQDVSYLSFERKYKNEKNIIKKILFKLEYNRLKLYELNIVNMFDKVYTVNKKDADLLGTSKKVEVFQPFINKWIFDFKQHEGFNIMFWEL